MASSSLRKFDEQTPWRLRTPAAKHGVSMEEKARGILENGVGARDHLGALALRIFGVKHGVELQQIIDWKGLDAREALSLSSWFAQPAGAQA